MIFHFRFVFTAFISLSLWGCPCPAMNASKDEPNKRTVSPCVSPLNLELLQMDDPTRVIYGTGLAMKGQLEKAQSVLNSVITNSKTHERTRIMAQLEKSSFDLWDDVSKKHCLKLLSRAPQHRSLSPARQAQALLYIAIPAVEDRIEMHHHDAYKLLLLVSRNLEANPEDQARADLWRAQMRVGHYACAVEAMSDDEAEMRLILVSNNSKAYACDQSLANFYIALMNFEQRVNTLPDPKVYKLCEVAEKDPNLTQQFRPMARRLRAMMRVEKRTEKITDDEAFQILAAPCGFDLTGCFQSTLYTAILGIEGRTQAINKDEAFKRLITASENGGGMLGRGGALVRLYLAIGRVTGRLDTINEETALQYLEDTLNNLQLSPWLHFFAREVHLTVQKSGFRPLKKPTAQPKPEENKAKGKESDKSATTA